MKDAPQNNWLTTKRMICIGLLLLAAGYVFAQPTLEKWLGRELPNLIDNDTDRGTNSNNRDIRPNIVTGDAKAIDQSNTNDKTFKINDRFGNEKNSTTRDRSATKKSGTGPSSKFELRDVGRGALQSPAGLIYSRGRREHRIDHVMLHAKDDPGRPVHGVFDANHQQQVLQIIDEAYELVKTKSRLAKE